jgi:hypothetical protein
MRLVFPNSYRINRGNYVVKELADACRANDITDLIVLHEHRGIPGEPDSCTKALLLQTSVFPRRHDRLALPPRSDRLLYSSERQSASRYWLLQVIHSIGAIPSPHL